MKEHYLARYRIALHYNIFNLFGPLWNGCPVKLAIKVNILALFPQAGSCIYLCVRVGALPIRDK